MKKIIKIILSLVVIAGVVLWLWSIVAPANFSAHMRWGSGNASTTDAEVLSRLSTILVLPSATPTMALVTDADALKADPNTAAFFANAENNDRVIIYPSVAILYDYSANKILNLAPVSSPTSIGQPASDASSAASSTKAKK